MSRTHCRAGFTTAALVPILVACSADTTGPGGADLPVDQVTVRIESILVPGDCDPALDNPGDFQGWVEVWQDVNAATDATDYRQVAASPKRSEAIQRQHALLLDDEMQVTTSLARDPGRPVSVRAYVNELDNSVVDEGISQQNTLIWSATHDCWMNQGDCMPTAGAAFVEGWRSEQNFRPDIFDLFNPDDESCHFTVNVAARIDLGEGE